MCRWGGCHTGEDIHAQGSIRLALHRQWVLCGGCCFFTFCQNPTNNRRARGVALHHPRLGQLNIVCAGEPSAAHSIKVMAGVFVGQGEQGLYASGSPGGAAVVCNDPSVSMYEAEHRGLIGRASREPTRTM